MKNPLGTEPRRPLTKNERNIFENDGVALLAGVLDSGWIAFLRDAFEKALSNPGSLAEEYVPADGPGRFFADLNMWQRIPAFRQFVFESPAAKIAAEVMGSSTGSYPHLPLPTIIVV